MSPKDVEARKVARDASKAEFTAKGVQVSAQQLNRTAQLDALYLSCPTQSVHCLASEQGCPAGFTAAAVPATFISAWDAHQCMAILPSWVCRFCFAQMQSTAKRLAGSARYALTPTVRVSPALLWPLLMLVVISAADHAHGTGRPLPSFRPAPPSLGRRATSHAVKDNRA